MIASRRRYVSAALLLALLAAAFAAIHSPTTTGATTIASFTTVRTRVVSRPGRYAVVVKVPARAAATTVSVFVGSQAERDVSLAAGQGAAFVFYPYVRGSRIGVRTVSTAVAANVGIAAAFQPPQTAASGPTQVGGATDVTGSTGATGGTGATGAAATTINAPPNGRYTKLAWSETFDGPAGGAPNPADWTPDTNGSCGPGTLSATTDSLANASTNGQGQLDITAAQNGPASFSSAQLDTKGLVSMRYGEIEARIEVPPGSGLCAGFWMVGNTAAAVCSSQCGEIDIMEAISPLPDAAFATLHGPVQGSPNDQQWEQYVTSATPLTGSFHTYGVVWRRGSVTWTIDGVPYATATPQDLPRSAQWVFDSHPFHILLDLAVGGWPGAPASGARFPATMRVDWVRIYS
jgi:beta-glucanase (GH16 family)